MMKRQGIRKCAVPTRYIIAIMAFFGFFNVYAMRINMSVAIVAMVNSSPASEDASVTMASDASCPADENGTIPEHKHQRKSGEFNWDMHTQSTVLGSFFYGYMATHLFGGVLADRFGPKWVFGLGNLVSAILTLATPAVARIGVPALVTLRVIIGMAEGVMFPSSNVLVSRWAPKMERSRFFSFMFVGMSCGSVITMSSSGMMIDSGLFGGWPSTFYLFGMISCLWFLFWVFLVYDCPTQHPRISEAELAYILEHKERPSEKKSIPWKRIFTSVPVWALLVSSYGHLYAFHMIITETPTYLANVLHFNTKANGLLSALPQMLHSFGGFAAAFTADRMRKSGRFSITTIRKIFNSIAYFGSGTCLLLIAFSGCRPILIVALICIAMLVNGLTYAGCPVTHLDMSPDYAGTLVGITDTIGSTTGFLAPYVVGQLTYKAQTFHNWGTAFIIAAVMYFVSGIVYAAFASAELQPWDSAFPKAELAKEQMPEDSSPAHAKTVKDPPL